MQTIAGKSRRAPLTDASCVWRIRSLPIKPTNLKLADIKRAVRATLEERAAKAAKEAGAAGS